MVHERAGRKAAEHELDAIEGSPNWAWDEAALRARGKYAVEAGELLGFRERGEKVMDCLLSVVASGVPL